jgi:hypothetical protein
MDVQKKELSQIIQDLQVLAAANEESAKEKEIIIQENEKVIQAQKEMDQKKDELIKKKDEMIQDKEKHYQEEYSKLEEKYLLLVQELSMSQNNNDNDGDQIVISNKFHFINKNLWKLSPLLLAIPIYFMLKQN